MKITFLKWGAVPLALLVSAGCFDYISSGSTFFAEFTGCNKTSPAVDREKNNRRALRQQQSRSAP